MSWIDDITIDNFSNNFDIKAALAGSVFYPVSGIDASDIELLSEEAFSYVHSDNSTGETEVVYAMQHHFKQVGYNLIGIKRLQSNEYSEFGLWAIYELDRDAKQYSSRKLKKVQRFSLLHLHADGCVAFEKMYLNNSITPLAIFDKSNSYAEHGSCLHQLITANGAKIPKYISTFRCGWLNYNQLPRSISELFNH
jgi:hypothetical protein